VTKRTIRWREVALRPAFTLLRFVKVGKFVSVSPKSRAPVARMFVTRRKGSENIIKIQKKSEMIGNFNERKTKNS